MSCGHALTAVPHPTSLSESGATQPVDLPETLAAQATARTAPMASTNIHEAERRQLTVLFCNLSDSTGLAGQPDPGDLREGVRA
jgi:hypothetical protein